MLLLEQREEEEPVHIPGLMIPYMFEPLAAQRAADNVGNIVAN